MNINLNYKHELPRKLKDRIVEISKTLVEKEIGFVARRGYGSGTNYLDIIEESLSLLSVDKSKIVVFIVDGDSYKLDDKEFLNLLKELGERCVKENALMGAGMRDRVILGKGMMETYREIDELFSSIFVAGRLEIPKRSSTVPLAYRELGDPVSGIHCINTTHKRFVDFFKTIMRDLMHCDLTSYSGDFYIAMLAAKINKIVSTVIPVEDNPPGSFGLGDIIEKSRQLGKTVLRDDYLSTVKSDKSSRILENYYKKEHVAKVKGMILGGLYKSQA